MTREADRLAARIRQIRRAFAPPDASPGSGAPAASAPPELDPLTDLGVRVSHLEQMVQGLQDSIYRDSQRYDKRITDLEARVDPAALAAALSKDARERGL